MDEIDRAEALQAEMLERSIAEARRKKALPPIGECYNCNEPLPGELRYCDVDCRDDYERRERR